MSDTYASAKVNPLVVGIEELRRIRSSASVPFFASSARKDGAISRVQRISTERKRLYGTGWRKLRSRTSEGMRTDFHKETASPSTITQNRPQYALEDTSVHRSHELEPSDMLLLPRSVQSLHDHAVSSQNRAAESLKLQATVKLLSESLEEIGALRALLEQSINPATVDRILNAVTGEAKPVGPENSVPDLKYRALLLEQSRLADQVYTLRYTTLPAQAINHTPCVEILLSIAYLG
jgi:hypothetical protein